MNNREHHFLECKQKHPKLEGVVFTHVKSLDLWLSLQILQPIFKFRKTKSLLFEFSLIISELFRFRILNVYYVYGDPYFCRISAE